ncbi:DUF4062 domain-containing protein [Frateuria edaphi]|uniref:DUF4062 domain-containing protein n=1 Tax=Frateuria edaphi TaxID=2898793 RepID=UPI001E39F420|nr:DUF4062 domain-containing protein [Frateuria edaphi]UGB44269.1 DUF4062 domain-containing protein [Frateuria edaphi]
MDRRHQVFISSTFSDLKQERAEVVQALLELDCFPAGMEIFPATSEGAWDLIKGVIDDSDYYLLVVGGRYGSTEMSGLSYTEKEYDYAVSIGKPIVAFLHGNPGAISLERSEQSEAGRERLAAFRSRVEAAHHCKYWCTPDELGGKVSRSIVALRKTHPSDGWVPGAYATDENSRVEVAMLRARVAELEAQLNRKLEESNMSVADLSSGLDEFETDVYFKTSKQAKKWHRVNFCWDQILKYVGPTLLPECSDEEFVEKLHLCFAHAAEARLQKEDKEDKVDLGSVILPHVIVDAIKVQFRALGYMVPGTKRRAVSDRKTYWKLSTVGEAQLLKIQAIRKEGGREKAVSSKRKKGSGSFSRGGNRT